MNIFSDFKLLDFEIDSLIWDNENLVSVQAEGAVAGSSGSIGGVVLSMLPGIAGSVLAYAGITFSGGVKIVSAVPGSVAGVGKIAGGMQSVFPVAGELQAESPIAFVYSGGGANTAPAVVIVLPSVSGVVQGVPSVADMVAGARISDVARFQNPVIAVPGVMVVGADVGGIATPLIPVVSLTVSGLAGGLTMPLISPCGIMASGAGISKVRYFKASLKRAYQCFLSEDFSGVAVPIAAFTWRQQIGAPGYTEITIPGFQHLDDVMQKFGTYYTVYATIASDENVILQREAMFSGRVDLVNVTGSDNLQSVIVSGQASIVPNGTPQVLQLEGVTYSGLRNGSHILRTARPVLYLKLGDTVTYRDDAIQVGRISNTVALGGMSVFEVAE